MCCYHYDKDKNICKREICWMATSEYNAGLTENEEGDSKNDNTRSNK